MEVPAEYAEQLLESLDGASLEGRTVHVRIAPRKTKMGDRP